MNSLHENIEIHWREIYVMIRKLTKNSHRKFFQDKDLYVNNGYEFSDMLL